MRERQYKEEVFKELTGKTVQEPDEGMAGDAALLIPPSAVGPRIPMDTSRTASAPGGPDHLPSGSGRGRGEHRNWPRYPDKHVSWSP